MILVRSGDIVAGTVAQINVGTFSPRIAHEPKPLLRRHFAALKDVRGGDHGRHGRQEEDQLHQSLPARQDLLPEHLPSAPRLVPSGGRPGPSTGRNALHRADRERNGHVGTRGRPTRGSETCLDIFST